MSVFKKCDIVKFKGVMNWTNRYVFGICIEVNYNHYEIKLLHDYNLVNENVTFEKGYIMEMGNRRLEISSIEEFILEECL